MCQKLDASVSLPLTISHDDVWHGGFVGLVASSCLHRTATWISTTQLPARRPPVDCHETLGHKRT